MTFRHSIILRFVLWLLLAATARGEWRVLSAERRASGQGGVEHVETRVEDAVGGGLATLHFAVFSPKMATLRVIDDPAAQSALADAMQREKAVAGVNGGYFAPDYAVVGLLISDGRVVAPLRKARLLSGVVSAGQGRVQIQRAAEFAIKAKPTAARQCGPFLVERGAPVPGLNSTKAARRTFVGIGGADRAAIGYSSHVTLAQLGAILATPGIVPDLKFQRALNLDGGSSSGFWFAGEDGPFSIRERKTVRDFIAVVPR